MKTKNITLTALMLAVGIVLPAVIRSVGAGVWLSPMHIPVFLAGLCISPVSGLITGLLLPFLNYALSGMPAGSTLIAMSVELPVYGLVSGLLMKALPKKHPVLRIYISLIIAMIAGRAAGGLMQAFIFQAGSYSLSAWIAQYFIATAPGMAAHLILVPLICYALNKAHLTNQ